MATVVGEPWHRWADHCRGPPVFLLSVEVGEVFAHGVVAGQHGGVGVGGDPVHDRVGQDLFVHPVVPLPGRELGAVDRRGPLVPPIDQGVQLLDLLAGRGGQEPVVDDQQLDADQRVEAAFLVPGAFGDGDAIEQFPGG